MRFEDGIDLRGVGHLLSLELRGGAQRVPSTMHTTATLSADSGHAQGHHDVVVQAAIDFGLEDGAKLRVDTA